MRPRGSICLLALACAVPAAHAEPVFVIETLVVNVSSEPGGAGERVATVRSGDRLELIERQGEEAHVQLADGKDGWIRSSYVSGELPLQTRLSARTAELDKLRQDVSRLESELASARAAQANHPAAAPSQPPEPAVSGAAAARPDSGARLDAAPTHDAAVFLNSPDEPVRPLWEWVLGTAVLTSATGFALGWRTLDRRIRRKYGGLRIY